MAHDLTADHTWAVPIERADARIYIPWVSMLLVSIALSILISLFRR